MNTSRRNELRNVATRVNRRSAHDRHLWTSGVAVFAALTLAALTVTTNAVQLDFDHGRVTI
jgi:hypothetical protein